MNCIFTQQETKNKTRNYPVSSEGRKVLRERQIAMAEVRLEEHRNFIEELNKKREEAYDGTGEFPTPMVAQTTIDTFMPSIKEVLQEQVRQNELEE